MRPKNVSLEDLNGTKCASNVECAANCWTPPTAQSTKVSSSARTATHASTDPRATASEVVLDACPWTPEPSSLKERKSRWRRRRAPMRAARSPRRPLRSDGAAAPSRTTPIFRTVILT